MCTCKSMALVSFPGSGSGYQLMAKKQLFYELPVIINSCPTYRCEEWVFDVIEEAAVKMLRIKGLFNHP